MSSTGSTPVTLVILGITGDLAAKKIIPALFHLFQNNQLPRQFRIIGFARREMDDQSFQAFILERLKPHLKHAIDSADLHAFAELFFFVHGQFDEQKDYASLKTHIHSFEKNWGIPTNRLLYLAVPPELYQPIFSQLSIAHLAEDKPDTYWTRLLIEKPIGSSAETAEYLNRLMGSLFREEQIYRIEHYLAKQMLQNILVFRFYNSLFENVWNHQSIEHIHIRMWETLGVETRGAFYEQVGALRDVGQNHLLQILALVTMERPQTLSADDIRKQRAAILRDLSPPSPEDIRTKTVRAQYEGYRQIQGTDPRSFIETFFRIHTTLNHPNWKDVGITLESGKRLQEARKEIIVTFKHTSALLTCGPKEPDCRNRIIFSLEPNESISIRFWSKKPGHDLELEPRSIDFLLRQAEHRTHTEEYEKLLLDCIDGDQTLFISTDELKAMWRFTDPIVKGWQQNLVPLLIYPPGTTL